MEPPGELVFCMEKIKPYGRGMPCRFVIICVQNLNLAVPSCDTGSKNPSRLFTFNGTRESMHNVLNNIVLNCFVLTFASEMGDKTQFLALVLATRFKQPWTVLAAVLLASLASLGLAACFGGAVAAWLGPGPLRWILGLSFLGFSVWLLFPEKEETVAAEGRQGAFWTTVVAIFFAEMGDKAQLSVGVLGAHYAAPLQVTLGAALGMLSADALAVVFGQSLLARIPMVWVRRAASLLFALFGVAALASR
jgi:Ca2+/H+ antiporter, TMEM165/GDT1 family